MRGFEPHSCHFDQGARDQLSIQYASAFTSRMRISVATRTLAGAAVTSGTLSIYLKSSDACQVPQLKTRILRVMFLRLCVRSCSILAARNGIQNEAPHPCQQGYRVSASIRNQTCTTSVALL